MQNIFWKIVLGIMALSSLELSAATNAFDAQGHRGARGLAPENTLTAFSRALAIGVNTLELDVGITHDGAVVITHNPRLNPETTRDRDGNWLAETGPAIYSLSLVEVMTFDVGRIKPGTRYHKRFPDQLAADGERIPTLEELFRLVESSGNEDIRFNIETKIRPEEPGLTPHPAEFVEAILKVTRQYAMTDRITIQSFDWRTLQHVSKIAPDIPTVYLSAQQRWLDTIEAGKTGASPWTAGYDIDDFDGDLPRMVKAAGGDIWSPFHGDINPAKVARAKSLGLQVIVWTVNDEPRMHELIDMGVDGIISDYPDRLMELLRNR